MINFLIECSLCKDNALFSIVYIIKQIMQVVFILVPIILIVLVLIDIAKNVIAKSEEDMKKNKNIAIKRIIYAVIIFFVPFIVNTFMKVLNNTIGNPSEQSFLTCWQNATLDNVKQCNEEAIANEEAKDEKKKQDSEAKKSEYENKIEQQNASKTPGLGKKEETQNDNSNNNNNDGGSNTNDSNLTEEEKSKVSILFIGDSRTNGMCSYATLGSNESCIAKDGAGIAWLKSNETKNKIYASLNNKLTSYVIINLGVNGISGLSKSNIERNVVAFVDFYKELASKYPNAHIIATSVGPVDEAKEKSAGYSVTNTNVNDFNSALQTALNNTSIKYCDVNSKMNNNFQTVSDGLHYTAETYKQIYNAAKSCF